MTTYAVKWEIGNFPLGSLAEIVERLRERGYPQTINLDGCSIICQYEVGGDDTEVKDLWDLRGVVEEVADELGAYYDGHPVTHSRPVEVPDA